MDAEKKSMVRSLTLPVLFVGLLWIVHFIAVNIPVDLTRYGVLPRTAEGLVGIVASPLIHADLKHLFSNSIPLIVLGAMLLYFYRTVAIRVFLWTWLLGGFWLWLGGRFSYHIGASGLVFGLTAFLFVSGLLRRHTGLMAVSLVVVFLYGSIIWGIFPLFREVSWEAHLFGLLAGLILAVVYRKEGPQRKKYDWEDEEEEDDDDIPRGYYDPGYYEDHGETYGGMDDEEDDPVFRYVYKPRTPPGRAAGTTP